VLVPPRDPQALADALVELASSPSRRAELGRAGRRFVEKYYVWQDNARLMEEVYRAALAGERPVGVPVYRRGSPPPLSLEDAG